MTPSEAPPIQSIRLDGEQWTAALAQVSARPVDRPDPAPSPPQPARAAFRAGPVPVPSPVDLLARHGAAPVRLSVVGTAGDRGSVARASLVGAEALVILRAVAEHDTRVLVEPGAELRLATPHTLWRALHAAIPPLDVLRAPAGTVGPDPGTEGAEATADAAPLSSDAGAPWPGAALADADAVVQVVVEAWPTTARLARFWSRLWAVSDGALFDVRRRDGTLIRTPRPAGSVAAELQWALVGALGTATEQRNEAR